MIVIHIVNDRQPQNGSSLSHRDINSFIQMLLLKFRQETQGSCTRTLRDRERWEAKTECKKCLSHIRRVWQKMMKNLFANQFPRHKKTQPTRTTLTIFQPHAITICLPFVLRTQGKTKLNGGPWWEEDQTKHYSKPSMPSHCVRFPQPPSIHSPWFPYLFPSLCFRFTFFGFIISSRLWRFPPKTKGSCQLPAYK